MIEKTKNTPIHRPSPKPLSEERDPITDIRLPLMILFLSAATASFAFELPAWITLPLGSVFGFAWALVRERALLTALVQNWRTPWLLMAPLVALFIYALLELLIQAISSAVIGAGGLSGQQELPTLFSWLLTLRASAGALPPALLGLGAGILLGVGEELFWRGFVQTRLMLLTSHGAAVLISSLLYSLFYFFSLGPLGAILSLFIGIMLSMFTLRSRSLLPAMVCHATFLISILWWRPDIIGII